MPEGKEGYTPSSEEMAKAEEMMTDEQREQSKIREQFRKEIKKDYEEVCLVKLAEGEEDAESKVAQLLKVFPRCLNWRDAAGRGYTPDAEVKSIGTGIFSSELSDLPVTEERRQKWEKRVTDVQEKFRKAGIKEIEFPCYQKGRDAAITYGEVQDDIFRPEIIIVGTDGTELVYKGTPKTIQTLSKRLGYHNPDEQAFFDRMYEKAQIRANVIAHRRIEEFLQGKGAL